MNWRRVCNWIPAIRGRRKDDDQSEVFYKNDIASEHDHSAAEDLADIEAARAARAEVSAEGSVPWDQVKADLGLI